jgi:hypothetical protein
MEQKLPDFTIPNSAQLLIDLENQQDDLLRALDELNARIEKAIVSGQLGVRRPGEMAGQIAKPQAA